jgi:hypothetical protein
MCAIGCVNYCNGAKCVIIGTKRLHFAGYEDKCATRVEWLWSLGCFTVSLAGEMRSLNAARWI